MLAAELGIPLVTLVFLLLVMAGSFLLGCETGHRAERRKVIRRIRNMPSYEEMWGVQPLDPGFFEGKCNKIEND